MCTGPWLFCGKLDRALASHRVRDVARVLLSNGPMRRLVFADAGHGFDTFGFDPSVLETAARLGRFAYERYFRVDSTGVENVPRSGAAILASNHGGTLPLDAALIVLDVLYRTHPPRVARPIGDVFIPLLPWVGALFTRLGVVGGARNNFRHLLENGELPLVFPEGVPGIKKGFQHRYELQTWRVGHVELAIRHQIPIVPTAVIGAEEAWPLIGRIDRFHLFGAPFLPIPLVPLPLPVRCHVRYGEPILLSEQFKPADADDPEVSVAAAEVVKRAVADLIARGRRERNGLFR
jgi:1-acyl-sn-glycerol-3-phosphate acyltransferase